MVCSVVTTKEHYMTHETEADAICEAGHKAGKSILAAIDDAYYALGARKVRRVFDAMVESLAGEMPSTECDLFTASAYEALPDALSTAVERAEINSNAWRAYEVFVGDAREAEAEARADYYRDLARDERVSS
jgi:hypothetical protein